MLETDQAYDYDHFPIDYAAVRREDPHIGAQILDAIGEAPSVVNVGAGAGSYEPRDRWVLAVEPHRSMRAARLAAGRPPAVAGDAMQIPLDDDAVAVATAFMTIHHWPDLAAGLRECARVARHRVVVLTCDPAALGGYWFEEYFPAVLAAEAQRFPSIEQCREALPEATMEVRPVLIDRACQDGFQEAFYARPHAFLDERVRAAQSAWSYVDADAVQVGLEHLRRDLDDGSWIQRHGRWLEQPCFVGPHRLLVYRLA